MHYLPALFFKSSVFVWGRLYFRPPLVADVPHESATFGEKCWKGVQKMVPKATFGAVQPLNKWAKGFAKYANDEHEMGV